MKFAIISAGEGSRLSQEGMELPKPLVPLNGVPMIERLIRIFVRCGATSVVVIINGESPLTKEFLSNLRTEVPLEIIVKTTPSSMHSFYELSPYLKDDKFCLTTVDTVFHEEEFAAFIKAFEKADNVDGYMAVTDYIDDEKPLYISTDDALKITGFHDARTDQCSYISGGIYCLTSPALDTLKKCLNNGMSRMRNYQRQLVEDGLKLQAYPFTKIVDVDHVEDIASAEAFLDEKNSKFSILGITRGSEYSPNHVGNDAAIYNKVKETLEGFGCRIDTVSEKEFVARRISAPIIFNMARDRSAINRLQELEDKGSLVINSAYGIDNCVRLSMTKLLIGKGIPHPASVTMSLDKLSFETSLNKVTYPCWIKRGDSHAMVKEDVCYVCTQEEAWRVLENFKERGISSAVINEHLQGDLIKFYGVQDTDFFYWFYPSPCSHSKFGLEKINGEAKGIPFSESELRKYCADASIHLNVPVYGGDCVILPTGEIKIIDFNDFPSFARCREQAGENIAAFVFAQAKLKLNSNE